MAPQLPCAPSPPPIDVDAPPFQDLFEEFLRRGEESARIFVQRYSGLLMPYIQRYLLPRTSSLVRHIDPEDVLQEGWKTFLQCLKKGGRFAEEDPFVHFMQTVMRRYTWKYQRYRFDTKKRSGYREEVLDVAKHDKPTSEPGPVAWAEWEDRWQHVLDGCPEKDRPFVQEVLAGTPTKEIANKLGIPLRTAERKAQKIRELSAR
jgi:RNA polymerase sigma factor (sigma-70 family)